MQNKKVLPKQLDRQDLISFMIDCLGFGEDELEGESKQRLWEMLSNEEKDTCVEYSKPGVMQ